jgi:competence protein ComEA
MNRLSRHLLILALSLFTIAGAAPAQTGAKATTAQPATTQAAVADPNKLDINTASADQLMGLKGIGDAYSKRIIAGRPYTAKNQLTSRGILPAATYNSIKDQIIARAPKK